MHMPFSINSISKKNSSNLLINLGLLLVGLAMATSAMSATVAQRDEFYWLSEINKATAVINTAEGLLDKNLVGKITSGIQKVIDDGAKPGSKRPNSVISYEPLLIDAAGAEVTLLHAGRSSQDMHATFRSAMLRDDLLELAKQLNITVQSMISLAEKNTKTIVPNYTNGIAAQPNSYAHYLLGYTAGFERDAHRIREAYARVDRSSMGTTVLNGTPWPLNREKMADFLGFSNIVDNAYDASQISSVDEPVEVGQVITSIALHTGSFIEDIMSQYSQTRPWILLAEGNNNTYVSSAMPQKKNPGLLINTRADASTTISMAFATLFRAHNLAAGMVDAKDSRQNKEMVQSAIRFLKGLDKILNALVISPERALEELNNDWTASQEIADVLMHTYKVPFRVGHHFASALVDYGKKYNIPPLAFPYDQAQKIYRTTVAEFKLADIFPMSEEEFRSSLNPISIVNNRKTRGGSQPSEISRMMQLAKKHVDDQSEWINIKAKKIDTSLGNLDKEFDNLRLQH